MNVDVASVGSVGFSLLSPETIRRLSVCCVTEPMLYDKGLPRQNSVLDLRLGTTDRRFLCSTCKHDMRACSGHFGHIDLALPLFNPVYIELTLKVLRCVCYFCSGMLVPARRRRRLVELTSHAMKCRNVSVCPTCRGAQPSWSRVGITLRRDFGSVERSCFESDEELHFAVAPTSTSDVYSILKNISDDDQVALGFKSGVDGGRPEYLMITTLLVPPVVMRPSVSSSESSRTKGHDDLTQKLQGHRQGEQQRARLAHA